MKQRSRQERWEALSEGLVRGANAELQLNPLQLCSSSLGELLLTVPAILIAQSVCAAGKRRAFETTVWVAWHLVWVLNLHPGYEIKLNRPHGRSAFTAQKTSQHFHTSPSLSPPSSRSRLSLLSL